MRFLHLADLHFGKSLHGVSLLDGGDQRDWVERFLKLAEELRPDAVVLAGDVYDRSAPSGEAVQLLSRFLTSLTEQGIPVMLTAGNHDSVQRLSFASGLLARQGVHISRPLVDSPELVHVTLQDAFGPVTFWLLPYIFPALAAQALGEGNIRDYDTAVRAVLAAQPVDFTRRNVLLAHQNVTANGTEVPRGGSESMVGGVGQVDYTAFDGFDYVALGHIHSAYPVGRESVRYAGSPLCYHFSETKQRTKGPVLVELGAKGTQPVIAIHSIPALHPLREIRGAYAALKEQELADRREGEYLRVVLTDQRVTPEISDFFRTLFAQRHSVLMELVSEYTSFREAASTFRGVEESPLEDLFAAFYEDRFGEAPQARDRALFAKIGELTRRREEESAAQTDIDSLLACIRQQGSEEEEEA